jgi:hypothetical protein
MRMRVQADRLDDVLDAGPMISMVNYMSTRR